MRLNPFKKTRKNVESNNKKLDSFKDAENISEESNKKETTGIGSLSFSDTSSSGAYRILNGFFVSEKSSLGNSIGQYVFKVYKNANKSEIKKEVSKLFDVKVKNVKILNMPEKRRDFGRHPGVKSGFKKAIVVLEKGQVIGQVKS